MRTRGPLRPGGAGPSVVVLGGTGFLGRHICSAFRQAGARTLAVSRSTADAATGRATPLDLAAASPGQLAELLTAGQVDVVVNAVGRVWGASDAEMAALNADFVERLVGCLAGQPDPPRLIQLGSVHEYGPGMPGTALAEDQEPAPDTAYGRTKLRGTDSVLRAARTRRLDGVVLRVANALGPGAPRGSLLGSVAHQLADAARRRGEQGGPLVLTLAALRVYRDFVDARDVADAVVEAAMCPPGNVTGQVINIGSGRPVLVRELVERLVSQSGVPVRIDPADESVSVGSAGSGAAQWQQLDISRARDLLGWSPRRHQDESLRALLAAA